MKNLVIGSRKSKLALLQSNMVKQALTDQGMKCEIKTIMTHGDCHQETAVMDMGGSTVFVKALEQALQAGEIDIAVHSLKDMAIDLPTDLSRSAYLGNASRLDVLVTHDGKPLHDLPQGATIGTGSLRRNYQLMIARADLKIVPMRGNVDKRIEKLLAGQVDGLVLAAAGLERLDINKNLISPLTIKQMVPAGGQGIMAIETRHEDRLRWPALKKLNNQFIQQRATIEFNFLKAIGATCLTPVGVYVEDQQNHWQCVLFIATSSGDKWLRFEQNYSKADEGIGQMLANELGQRWRQAYGEQRW